MDGDVHRARKVPRGELLRRAHVEDGDEALSRPLEQLPRGDRLEAVLLDEIEPDDSLHLRDVGLADAAERREQAHDRVARQAVIDVQPLLPPDDQARLAELLEVLRGVGDRDPGEGGELVDAALALGEELEELQPGRARERRADAGERLEDGALGGGG